jgi:hypothetical protein
MTMDNAEWKRRTLRLKDLNSEAYDLACDLAALIDGRDDGQAGAKWMHYVNSLPRFNDEAQRRALSDPVN